MADEDLYSASGHETPAHETRDISVRAIVITAVSLAAGAIVVAAIVYGVFWYLAEHPLSTLPVNPMATDSLHRYPPAPRIEEHPEVEVKQLRGQEDVILNTYGWVDKNAGIVRIPIDQAMDRVLEKGLPVRKEAQKQ
jgi:hypothetical protein